MIYWALIYLNDILIILQLFILLNKKTQGSGTVKDKPNFNGQKEAEILRKAMKGIGNYNVEFSSNDW